MTVRNSIIPRLTTASAMRTNTKLGKFLIYIDPFIFLCITINCIMIGVGTLDEIENNGTARRVFEICDRVFLIIFTTEVSLAMIHYFRLDRLEATPHRFLPEFPPITRYEVWFRKETRPWLIFDIIVILFSWAFSQGSVIRAFRILRALRLISKVQSLKNLTQALLRVCPKMGALLFITLVFLTVAGIVCTLLFKDMYDEGYTEYNYFGRIDLSLLTLFQMMTFDNWHEPVREIMVVYPYAWTVFVLWVFLSGFVIMNLIIAIICESLVNLDKMGAQAFRGQVILNEYSSRDIGLVPAEGDEMSNKDLMDLRMTQLEDKFKQLLDEEVYILEELTRIRAIKPEEDKTVLCSTH